MCFDLWLWITQLCLCYAFGHFFVKDLFENEIAISWYLFVMAFCFYIFSIKLNDLCFSDLIDYHYWSVFGYNLIDKLTCNIMCMSLSCVNSCRAPASFNFWKLLFWLENSTYGLRRKLCRELRKMAPFSNLSVLQ